MHTQNARTVRQRDSHRRGSDRAKRNAVAFQHGGKLSFGGLRRDYSLVLGDSTVPRTDGAPDDRKYKRYCAV